MINSELTYQILAVCRMLRDDQKRNDDYDTQYWVNRICYLVDCFDEKLDDEIKKADLKASLNN